MKKILQISIAFLCGMVAIQAQNLEKRIAPAAGSDLSIVTTLERLSGAGFSSGDRVYDSNLEASYQYTGNGKWILLSGAGDGSTGIASSSFGLPTLNAAVVPADLPLASSSVRGAVILSGSVTNDGTGSIVLANESVGSANLGAAVVTTSKIGDGAVISSKIVDGAVTSAKIANNSVTISKLSGTGAADGLIGVQYGTLRVINSNKLYSAISTGSTAQTISDTTVVNIFSTESIANGNGLADIGLDDNSGVYTYSDAEGFEGFFQVVSNINFRRNANDTGERTVLLELLDMETDGDGTNGNSDPVVIETISKKTVKGVVVADYPMLLNATFKLGANGGGTANGFRIRAFSSITNASTPVTIGGATSADNISIVRLQ